jgi:hypothetical protein
MHLPYAYARRLKGRCCIINVMVAPVPPAIAKIAPDGRLSPRQKRRFMINMLKRRVRPGAGSSIEPLA